MRHAIVNINTGIVENVILWDGVSQWSPANDQVAVSNETANIGWIYSDGEFTDPDAENYQDHDVQA